MLEKELEEILTREGASLVGFSNIEKSPVEGQDNLIFAVTICYKLSDSVLKTITDRPTIMYFQHYRAVNAKLDGIALTAVRFIENAGYNAFPIAASQSKPEDKYYGVFPHKTGAVLSGLGFIGKSGLLITKEYGSKVRFATVLTDMPLTPLREIIKCGCGSCEICKNCCPAGAITGINYEAGMPRDAIFSAEKCSEYMKTFKDVGRGAVCGICIKNCPFNKLK